MLTRTALLMAIVVATAVPAVADTPVSGRGEGKRRFDRGVTLFEEKNFEGALLEFEASYAVAPGSTTLLNMGLTLRALLRYDEAVRVFDRYLSEYSAESTPAERALVERSISEVRSLGGEVAVAVTPEPAVPPRITIDGRPAPGDRPVLLAAGRHLVEASAPGVAPTRRELVVIPGNDQTVTLHLTPVVIAPPVPPAPSLRAMAEPTVPPAPRPIYIRWWFWAAIGAVGAAAVVGTVLVSHYDRNDLVGGTLGGAHLP